MDLLDNIDPGELTLAGGRGNMRDETMFLLSFFLKLQSVIQKIKSCLSIKAAFDSGTQSQVINCGLRVPLFFFSPSSQKTSPIEIFPYLIRSWFSLFSEITRPTVVGSRGKFFQNQIRIS